MSYRMLKLRLGLVVLAFGFGMSMGTMAAEQPLPESPRSPPQGPFDFDVRPNVFITMRDGTRLATDLYFPRTGGARLPVVLIRTPYGNFPGGNMTDPIKVFASHGFIVAVQDKRGKFRSEGTYLVSGGDAEDGYDTIDWLSKQDWSNGKIGTYGCSYLGDVQIFAAGLKHPALKAMIPQASGSSAGSIANRYRYFGTRTGGASEWAASIGWWAKNGQKVAPKLPATLDEQDYNGAYRLFNQAPKEAVVDYPRAWRHLPMVDALRAQGYPDSDFADNISKAPTDPYWSKLPYMTDAYTSDVPTLFVNSWYDFGADITLFEFNWFREHSVSAQARNNQYVIMSPGTHCADVMGKTSSVRTFVGAREMGDTRFDYWNAYLTWFDYWLKGNAESRKRIDGWPAVRYFLMGGNKWQSAAAWPPRGTRNVSYYLGSTKGANSVYGDGVLSTAPAAGGGGSDSFIYDPDNPVQSLGGAMCCTGTSDAAPGAQDQRAVESRNDVLVYTTQPLASDIEVSGSVEVRLFVSSTAIDTDFTAKLVDVYPDGRAFNVLENILRARYREGFDREVWMQAGKVYEVRIPLGATSNLFGKGHRIRLEVSSSNFPRFDRNLNVGGVNAEQVRWVTATNEVHHSTAYPSVLLLPQTPHRDPDHES